MLFVVLVCVAVCWLRLCSVSLVCLCTSLSCGGHWWVWLVMLDFGIGMIFASFQICGMVSWFSERLKIWVR